MTTANRGLVERLYHATLNSLRGLGAGWRTQAPLRYEGYLLLVTIPAAWILGRSGVERALLIGSCLLVVIVELVNSAVESVVDRIGLESHELSGRAKDLASAAVFGAIVNAIVVWLLVLWGQR